MKLCPNCVKQVAVEAKFCTYCGYQFDQNQMERASTTLTQMNQPQPNSHRFTDTLSKYTGEESALKISLRDLFSEVFKSHDENEAEAIFIAGTDTTTPELSEVSDEWAKPWLFSRVLVGFLIAFIALLYMAVDFDNDNAIAGLILVGAFAVPVSGLIFFFESNAFKNVSLYTIMKVFFIGGVFSLVVTVFLYEFVDFSIESQILGTMLLSDAIKVGFIEELGKVLIISYFISKLNTKYVLNGILIGAAVGAGFAAFETAGYIYNAGNALLQVAVLRGWTALGGHLVWAAITGGALMLVKRAQSFNFKQLIEPQFLIFFAMAVGLHAVWDWDLNILGSIYLKYILLIVLAWIIVFTLMSAGLKEVSRLKAKQGQ